MNGIQETVRYSVGSACISCAACWRAVPEHFAAHEVHAHALVSKQPKSPHELSRCEEARLLCPVQAIHREKRKDS